MSKVIATRIKNVLPHIIHHNQTGYIKDRFIGETIRSIYDIMDWTVKENIPRLMIFRRSPLGKTVLQKHTKLYNEQRHDFKTFQTRARC